MDPEKARMERIRLREEEERMERKRRRKAMGAVSRVSVCMFMCVSGAMDLCVDVCEEVEEGGDGRGECCVCVHVYL